MSTLAAEVDEIVIARASRHRLRERLAAETVLPVLNSPHPGVELLARTLHRQAV